MTDTIKAVFVGDTGVGKVCLLIRMSGYGFPWEYIPLAAYCDRHEIPSSGSGSHIHCLRAPCNEDYVRLRPHSYYPGTHVFVLCFSVVKPESYQNVVDLWAPEIRAYVGTSECKILLVGTQSDLAMDEAHLDRLRTERSGPIDIFQGIALAKAIGASGYVETSALNGQGAEEVARQIELTFLGTQSELAMDEEYVEELRLRRAAPVNGTQGVALAKAIGAFGYVETSALNYQGVEEVTRQIELAFCHESRRSKRKQSPCSFMHFWCIPEPSLICWGCI
ncbi:P-loop containing nucleoside triphosphate hydrolase protein [Flagelloscypha sp. PMI_526]|nr:P-loop containing nucleoside triphosphate hydrolase protein [Flagelloscypha sp. PMI_526]